LRKWIAIGFLAFTFHGIRAQDYQYSQFYALPLYYNPAFAGANLNSRVVMAYRSQWSGLQGWKGRAGSFDWYLKNSSSGIGFFFSNNTLSQLGYSQNTGMLQYAYRAKWRKDIRVSFGIGLGFNQYSWNPDLGLMGDQLASDPEPLQSQDPLAASGGLSAAMFDMQIGILFYSKTWWAALSGLHPNSPTYTLVNDNSLEPRINLSGGYRFELQKPVDYKGQEIPVSITPALLIRSQGNASQLDLGMYYHTPPFVLGAWYRGIPVPVTDLKIVNHDAATLLGGIKQNNLTIGYSYDVPLNRATGIFQGSHEVTITYEFKTQHLSLKSRNKPRGLPCPTF
jgi:type IX secretion system PorP/SprF family membrane protein